MKKIYISNKTKRNLRSLYVDLGRDVLRVFMHDSAVLRTTHAGNQRSWGHRSRTGHTAHSGGLLCCWCRRCSRQSPCHMCQHDRYTDTSHTHRLSSVTEQPEGGILTNKHTVGQTTWYVILTKKYVEGMLN